MTLSKQYSIDRRLLAGIALNTTFILVEVVYGFQANSVALIADAVHNASDVLGLMLVWFSYALADRKPTHKFTYGYKNATIFAAFLNTIVLFIAVGNLIWESILRLAHPEPVVSWLVIAVAAVGVLVNGATALIFYKDREKDLNILSVYLNMALDTLLSLAIVIGGIFIWWKNWYLLDPLLGFVIAVTIIYSFWGLFKESLNLIFQAVPASINLHEIIKDIQSMPEIVGYHDLHVWALSTTETALSVHVVTSADAFNPVLIHDLAAIFRQKYNIRHATIQLEVQDSQVRCKDLC
jgi:cobalt-zinc-cadmium efflux system protein